MINEWVRLVVCTGFGLACVAGPRQARAWEAAQLTLQGTMLSYQKTKLTPDASADSSTIPDAVRASSTSYGLFGSSLSAGGGYAWDGLLLGARFQFFSSTSGDTVSSGFGFMPRVEYAFDPGQTGAFVAAVAGVEHNSSSTSSAASGGSSSAKIGTSGTDYLLGGALGLHAFIVPTVSIDPELTLLGGAGSATASVAGLADQSGSQSEVRVLFTLGLSAWLTPEHPAPAERTAPEAVPVSTQQPAAPAEDDEAKPLFTSIHLPGHRRLYLQVSEKTAQTSLIVRLTEGHGESALAACDDISVVDRSGAFKLRVHSHGEHFVTGHVPLHAVELLANSDATISACGSQWSLGTESREELQTFLADRRELVEKTGDSAASEPDASGDSDAAGAVPQPAVPAPAPAGASSAAPNAAGKR